MELAQFWARKNQCVLRENRTPKGEAGEALNNPPPLLCVSVTSRDQVFSCVFSTQENGDRPVLLAVLLVYEQSDRPTLEHRFSYSSGGDRVNFVGCVSLLSLSVSSHPLFDPSSHPSLTRGYWQGFLAYKKHPPPLGSPQVSGHRAPVGAYGGWRFL